MVVSEQMHCPCDSCPAEDCKAEREKGQAAIEALELLERWVDKHTTYLSDDMEYTSGPGIIYSHHFTQTLTELHTPDGRERIRKELEG